MELEQNEELIFTILAHPIRRRMLHAMYDENSLSFTTISKDWGIATGTIYHHLKILNPLILKDENSIYHINDVGTLICENYLKKNGKVKVQTISRFDFVSEPVVKNIDNNSKIYLLVFSIMILVGLILSYFMKISNLLVLILPSGNSLEAVILSSAAHGFYILFSSFFIKLNNKWEHTSLIPHISFTFAQIAPAGVITLLIFIALQFNFVSIPIWIWVLMTIINQITFVALGTIYYVYRLGISLERSVTWMLLMMYLFTVISFFLI